MTDEVTIENPEALLKAHDKLKEDITALRTRFKELEKEKAELETAAEALSPDNFNKMKERALKAEIRAQLEADGVPNADGVIKYLDLNDVDYDEEGSIVGVDEKLEALKTDLPLLFDKKARAGRSGADIHEKAPANTHKSTTEAQVDSLFR